MESLQMRLWLSFASLALAGCTAVAEPSAGGTGAKTSSGLEAVYTAAVSPDGIRVRVAYNGCTTKQSFRANVKKEEGADGSAPHYVVSLVRTMPDPCPNFSAQGLLLSFSR